MGEGEIGRACGLWPRIRASAHPRLCPRIRIHASASTHPHLHPRIPPHLYPRGSSHSALTVPTPARASSLQLSGGRRERGEVGRGGGRRGGEQTETVRIMSGSSTPHQPVISRPARGLLSLRLCLQVAATATEQLADNVLAQPPVEKAKREARVQQRHPISRRTSITFGWVSPRTTRSSDTFHYVLTTMISRCIRVI